jgi:cytochrome c
LTAIAPAPSGLPVWPGAISGGDDAKLNEESMVKKLIVSAVLIAISSVSGAAQDAQKGKMVFNVCLVCHAIGPTAQNKIGPELNGLDGRKAGTVPNFDYSDANKNSGIVWNEETFEDYIKNPAAKIPDTKMTFAGVKNEQQVKDLWAYISQFDASGNIKK